MKSLHINLIGFSLIGVMALCVYAVGVVPMQRTGRELELARAETHALALGVDQNTADNQIVEARIASVHQRLIERFALATEPGQPIIQTLSKLMQNHQLNLTNLREETHGPNSGIRVDIQVEGSYEDMMRFLHDLGRLDVPARIAALKITPHNGKQQACGGQFRVDFFPSQLVHRTMNGASHEQTL